MIRVVASKKPNQPRPTHFTYQALTGKFYIRVEKNFHSVEVTEICLDKNGKQSTIYDVLTKDELSVLVSRFPHLKQKSELPPEPEPLKTKDNIEALSLVGNDEHLADANDYATWSVDELTELLSNNDIKYDKRIKSVDKLIEIVKTNNL